MRTNKPYHIYGDNIDYSALNQFFDVMELDNVVQGALMPDAHVGYVLPVGGVVAVRDAVYPAFIGYDIGCGVCAVKTGYKRKELKGKEPAIFDNIYERIPCGESNSNLKRQDWNYRVIEHTTIVDEAMKKGSSDLGTLGGGNHFIEIAYDDTEDVWILVHSGSRSVGHYVATEYMKIAKSKSNVDTTALEKEFDSDPKNKELRKRNLEKYEEVKGAYVMSALKNSHVGNIEGLFCLDMKSKEGKDYFRDMSFCVEFALKNRETMIREVLRCLKDALGGSEMLDMTTFINRNHNHAEFKDGLYIHRKGATHAEDGMMGVIPGNMRDGSFIVEGKGNPQSLSSSSHGGGRTMPRSKVKEVVSLEEFAKSMKGITARIDGATIDESPFAYKNIFEVMDLQSDLVEIKHYLKPIINVKG